MDEGLPEDLESLFGLAKLMRVAPNLTAHADEHGFPDSEDMRFMYKVSLVAAIKNELKLREYEKKWTTNQH